MKAGRQADWDDPEWHMLDQSKYGSGARWHLGIAIKHHDFELAEWCLAHGANPNAAPPQDKRMSQRSLYEEALRIGHTEMAELLARYGAMRSTVGLQGEDVFVAACFQLNRAAARAQLVAHPDYLHSPLAMHTAAELDRADVVEFLLELGISPDVDDAKRGNPRPLHIAAYNGSARAAALLIERGAAEVVHGAEELGTRVAALLADPDERDRIGAIGRDCVDSNRGALGKLLGLAQSSVGSTGIGCLPVSWLL